MRELLRRRGLADEAPSGANLDRLLAHGWPGNVRELRNVLDRALALTPGAARFTDLAIRVDASAVAGEGLPIRSDLPYAEAKAHVLHELERRYIADVLAREDGNLSAASRSSGIDRKHLRTLARKHGLLANAGETDDDD